jgi:hypothetical protein
MTKRFVPAKAIALGLTLLIASAGAHDLEDPTGPVILEGNFMVADSGTGGGAGGTSIAGPGRVMEVDIMTGKTGIIFSKPDVIVGPWRPTGILFGGNRAHAWINGAAQHKISEFNRDGGHVRTVTPITAPPEGSPFGSMPRLLGSVFMPNGNIAVAVCDAEFPAPWNDFTRPASTRERAKNSRVLVLDPDTLEAIDEYSAPYDRRWTCMAGLAFGEDGMYVSMFHGAAVFVIDWEAGARNIHRPKSKYHHKGYKPLRLNSGSNRAKVVRVIDMYPGAKHNDPRRRDSLRAISFDANGAMYATNRARAADGSRRAVVSVVPLGGSHPSATIGLHPDYHTIAGIRIHRVSAGACAALQASDPTTVCNFETLYMAATSTGNVMEFLIDEDHYDAEDGTCTGDAAGDNSGCAHPISTFLGTANSQDNIDPRMLMVIHEAFVQ